MAMLDTLLAAIAGGTSGLASGLEERRARRDKLFAQQMQQQQMDRQLKMLDRQLQLDEFNMQDKMHDNELNNAKEARATVEQAYTKQQPAFDDEIKGPNGEVLLPKQTGTPISDDVAGIMKQFQLPLLGGETNLGPLAPATPKPLNLPISQMSQVEGTEPPAGVPVKEPVLPTTPSLDRSIEKVPFTRPASEDEISKRNVVVKAAEGKLAKLRADAILAQKPDFSNMSPEDIAVVTSEGAYPHLASQLTPKPISESKYVTSSNQPLLRRGDQLFIEGSNQPYTGPVKPYVDPLVEAQRQDMLRRNAPPDASIIGTFVDAVKQSPTPATILATMDKPTQKAVITQLAKEGIVIPKLTAQNQGRAELANNLVPKFEALKNSLTQADAYGILGPVAGRWQDFLFGKFTPMPNTGDPKKDAEIREFIGKFKDNVKLAKSALAMTHGGQRAAGSPSMLAQMEKLISENHLDLATLTGQLDAGLYWLKGYGEMGKAINVNEPKGGATPAPAASSSAPTPPAQDWIVGPNGKVIRNPGKKQ